MTLIGKEISDFSAMAYQDGDFKQVTKADLLGKWSVLFFYPADFTFVCPTELEDMQDNYDAFKEAGAEVYSISTDSHFTHKAWHESSERVGKVKYPMIADPTHAITRDFGIYIEEAGQAERGAFIVDPEGKVQVEIVTAGGIGRDADEILRLLQAAQFVAEYGDQVCPAKWHPGADTLTPGPDLVGAL